MTQSSAILGVRVSPVERSMLESAAQNARTSLSDFVRRTAINAAEASLAERTAVTIPAAAWARFEEWVAAPPTEVPALRNLAASKAAWRD